MADQPDRPSSLETGGHNIPTYTVGEISGEIKRTLERGFSHVRVRGEISGLKRAASGHVYLTLKDENATIDSVCWRGTANRLRFRPEDGLEVVVTGRVTTFSGRSKYQIVIESMEPAGAGALMALLEERKRKLAAEGLFAGERKQPIPFLPKVIGVVTSPTGAVIRDILHRLNDRFPRHVIIWPVLVQGDDAARQVATAIKGFNDLTPGGRVARPDVLIVARGGGSIEDLWAFNEEVVVRAAAESRIPLISAVGHETDTTLIDYASDLRAPTPTAAAEMAVPVRGELAMQVMDGARRLQGAMLTMLSRQDERVVGLARGLPRPTTLLDHANQRLDDRVERLLGSIDPVFERRRARVGELSARLRHPREQIMAAENRLARLVDRMGHLSAQAMERRQARVERAAAGLRLQPIRAAVGDGRHRLYDWSDRLLSGGRRLVDDAEQRLANRARLLDSYSYKKVLERGFALVGDREGVPVTTAAGTAPGMGLTVTFQDGDVPVTVEADTAGDHGGGTDKPVAKAAPVKRAKAASTDAKPAGKKPPRQESLF